MEKIKDILKSYGLEDIKMTYEELQQLNVDCYNAREGHLNEQDGVNCAICKNKGHIEYLRKNCIITTECECVAKRRIIRRAKKSGLGNYINKTINDYNASAGWQSGCKRKAQEYMELHAKDNVWFLALGQSGCGKTLLCSIIANDLLLNQDREVLYVTWTDFISKLKRDMMSENANEVSGYLEEIKNCDVLLLDEVLKKYNETDLKYLIEIINYRYTSDKKTILTSEKVIDELLDIDEATFGRAIEKCEGYLLNIPKDREKNYRLHDVLSMQ